MKRIARRLPAARIVPGFGLVLLLGCSSELPQTPPGKVVKAVFDPAKVDIPTPSDLAVKAGKVAIEPNEYISDAENELKLSFNGNDGFSTASTAWVRFSGALSAASLTDQTVLAIDLGDKGKGVPARLKVTVSYADCNHSLTLSAPNGFLQGHRYLFAVRGGADGAQGASGEPVVPSPVFHFLRAGKDLREHLEPIPGETREEKRKAAETLEGLRQQYEPLFQVLESQGLPRREVAILWSFTAQTGAELYFDPTSKRIPFPNDLLKDESTGLLSIPIDPAERPESQELKKGFSKLDGFSTTAAITLNANARLDWTTLVAGKTVRVFRRDTLEENTDIDVGLSEDAKQIQILPKVPLLPKTAYVVVVAGAKDEAGNPLRAMPLPSLLRLRRPVVSSEGRSQIASLCDADASRLEEMRGRLGPVLDKLAKEKVNREEVAAVFTFTTQDLLKRAQELYQIPYRENLPLTVKDVESKTPFELGLLLTPVYLPISFVSRVITGKMTTVDFLDPTTRTFRESEKGFPKDVEFVLTIPIGLASGESVPVVVFGHGMYTERRLGLMLANRLAQSGMAMMAIDLPLHGERTACTQDMHCLVGQTCRADGQCVTSNGSPGDFVRLTKYWAIPGLPDVPSPSGAIDMPVATGQAWIDVEHLFGSRDHFRQALIDLSAQTRLIRKMDWSPITGGHPLDASRMMYVGVSLGGITGATLAALDPGYKAMVLNVAGAGLVELMLDSSVFGPVLTQGLTAKNITKGTPEYFEFENAARWILDEVDPLNLVRYGRKEPPKYLDPDTGAWVQQAPKRLRVQMAIGDVVVPNSSTDRLLKAGGFNKDTEYKEFVGSHGFLVDPYGTDAAACFLGQDDMRKFLEGSL